MNDDNLFLAEMGDVVPLKSKNETLYFGKSTLDDNVAQTRRHLAEVEHSFDPNHLSLENIELVEPDDILSYKKDGVQQGVFKNLRLGKYSVHSVLNLRGKSVKESRLALFQFIQDCQKADLRSLLIQHGKGLNSQPHKAIIKSYINKWLPQFEQVLAFHSAQPQHGGTGSVYLLLKKSDNARLHNKEKHQKRGANK